MLALRADVIARNKHSKSRSSRTVFWVFMLFHFCDGGILGECPCVESGHAGIRLNFTEASSGPLTDGRINSALCDQHGSLPSSNQRYSMSSCSALSICESATAERGTSCLCECAVNGQPALFTNSLLGMIKKTFLSSTLLALGSAMCDDLGFPFSIEILPKMARAPPDGSRLPFTSVSHL